MLHTRVSACNKRSLSDSDRASSTRWSYWLSRSRMRRVYTNRYSHSAPLVYGTTQIRKYASSRFLSQSINIQCGILRLYIRGLRLFVADDCSRSRYRTTQQKSSVSDLGRSLLFNIITSAMLTIVCCMHTTLFTVLRQVVEKQERHGECLRNGRFFSNQIYTQVKKLSYTFINQPLILLNFLVRSSFYILKFNKNNFCWI